MERVEAVARVLEDHLRHSWRDTSTPRSRLLCVPSKTLTNRHVTLVGFLKAHEDTSECCLTRTRLTDDAKGFASFNSQIYPAERVNFRWHAAEPSAGERLVNAVTRDESVTFPLRRLLSHFIDARLAAFGHYRAKRLACTLMLE
jgi:hypothetical protein